MLSRSPERADELRVRLAHGGRSEAVRSGEDGLGECELFIEATVESLEAKRPVLRDAEARLPEHAIVATTTSSIPVTILAAELRAPDRFVGIHFFNPVQRMKLVEVVSGVRTAETVADRAVAFAAALGKTPIRVRDRAGFLVNALLISYLNRAARLVESGVASPEDVDRAMVLGAGHPIGPFALIDLIGADVTAAIGRTLHEESKRPGDMPSPELKRRVALGILGRKTGRGYYEYGRPRH